MAKQRGIRRRPGSQVTASVGYPALLRGVKQRIRAAQTRAALSANVELLHMYWDIGWAITLRQKEKGWGARVIPRLARDLHVAFPDANGFSERNLKLMVQFYHEYGAEASIGQTPFAQLPHRGIDRADRASDAGPTIGQPPVAQLSSSEGERGSSDISEPEKPIGQLPVAQLPWAHNVLLMQRVKDMRHRLWYMEQTLANGWSRDMLASMIDADAHARAGRAVNNFAEHLAPPQLELAAQMLKDPVILDFLTLTAPFKERELELELLRHVEKFLLELGQGFAFVGRQYRMTVGDKDFSIDLLFYHLRLRCFVVIDLKTRAFEPEHAGKMNFYCNVINAQLRHKDDAPTVGLILCRDKNRLVAEYALKGMNTAIGVSEYQLTRALPAKFKSSLPSIAEVEAELAQAAAVDPRRPAAKKARRGKKS